MRVLAHATAAAAVCTAVVACGSVHATSEHRTSSPARQSVYFADPVSPGFVVVAVGPTADGGRPARLLATTDGGRTFRDIGPHTTAGEVPDSVFFLDRTHGWFLTFRAGGGGERLFRTTDGGHRWQSFGAPEHSESAPSTDAVQFVTPEQGWLVDVQGTAPSETLEVTHDGGASWQPVAELARPGSRGAGLPRLGLTRFEPDGRTGWLGWNQGWWRGSLEVTHDGGRSWRPAAIPVHPHETFPLPSVFGATLLEPASVCASGRTTLRLYASADGGTRWALRASRLVATGKDNGNPGDCHAISTSFPSPSVGWIAAIDAGHVVVARTTDQGRDWHPVAVPRLHTPYACSIVASDAQRVWLLVAGVDKYTNRLYVSADGGGHWQRVDETAIAG